MPRDRDRTGSADQPPRPVPRVRKPVPALLRLQQAAGNAAVSDLLVQRACPAPAPAPPAVTPATDPRFRSVRTDIAAKAKTAKAHPPAAAEVKKSQDAAVAPADDKDAQAKADQADKMAAAKPAGFDKAGFVAAVNAAIAKQAPQNLDEADKFATSGKADAVKSEVIGKVAAGKDTSAKDVTDRTKETPDASKAVEKPVTPLVQPPTAPVAPVDTARAVPVKAPAEQTDLRADQCETHAKMAEAKVTDQQLAESNEPEFQSALAAKEEGEQHTATAPAAVRSAEAATLTSAAAAAQASGTAAVTGMNTARTADGTRGAAQRSATKTKDEQERARITGEIRAIFDETKTKVEGVLNALDGEVAQQFEKGEADAKAAFTADHKARMGRYREQRYSGVEGAARWTWDLFADLPAEANALFLESRKVYEQHMLRVINGIADHIGARLGEAKQLISDGRERVKQKVASQAPSLRKIAGEAADSFGDQFDSLESSVDEKQQSLVEDLASRYVEARNAVDEEIKALQEANKGLWSKAKEAVGGAIDTIVKLKDMLLGVLSRAAGAVELIIAKPIEFLGNLVNAVKTGVMNFAANILEHLKSGLKGWLLGNLASAGIEIPDTFDARGILRMILSILGLTWASVRARITRVIPEPVLAFLESKLEVVKILVTEGLPGLWKWVVEKLGDLKEMVLGQIKEFVVEKIVKAGITWIISLLNPAAAFVKACKAIYDVVMFFVDRAAQIKEFVDSVLDSVESIARGGVGAVAGLIEKTLAKAVPVVLGFLASLLGLGGISEKIKSILAKIQAPVGKVIDKVVGTIVKAGKKFIGKLTGKKDGKGDDAKAGPEKVKSDALRDAHTELRGLDRIDAAKPVLDGIRRRYREQGLKRLDLTASEDGKTAELTAVASPPDQRRIPLAEVFEGTDLDKLKLAFENKAEGVRNYVIAAVTVNGAMIGQCEYNESATGGKGGRHAEDMVIEQHWDRALEAVRKEVAAGNRPQLVFAISASPCQACSAKLQALIRKVRSDPAIGQKADFILAPRSTYEGRMDPKKKTTGKDLANLVLLDGVELGWDLRQLATKENIGKHWELPLAEWAHHLWERVKKAGKAA
ncbi:phage tail protein [Lentzea guizhouensis]|uniref:phage tail protein n=1 Tax=Lentzea guizhouensis TaxID=1586287 RepID=UPI001F1C0080|nr:hypothetical protein [Lentzea guizhouensis]